MRVLVVLFVLIAGCGTPPKRPAPVVSMEVTSPDLSACRPQVGIKIRVSNR